MKPKDITFPYSDEDSDPKECRYSGRGHIYCTQSIRTRKAKVCDTCGQNPDNLETHIEKAVNKWTDKTVKRLSRFTPEKRLEES